MRPLRRPPHPERPDHRASVHGAVALPAGRRSLHPLGDGPAPVPEALVELVATEAGMVVGSTAGSPSEVPSLIPWSAVTGAHATDHADLLDGTDGRVVEIGLNAEGWMGGAVRARYVVPAADVDPFLRAVSINAVGTGAGRPLAALTALTALTAGAWSAAAGWASTLRPAAGDPRHGLGNRRLAPIAVGMLALMLLAGSGRAFESAAS